MLLPCTIGHIPLQTVQACLVKELIRGMNRDLYKPKAVLPEWILHGFFKTFEVMHYRPVLMYKLGLLLYKTAFLGAITSAKELVSSMLSLPI